MIVIRTEKFFKKSVVTDSSSWVNAPITEVVEVRRRIWWVLLFIPLYIEYEEMR